MPRANKNLDTCGISPISKSTKNLNTPRRSKRKTSRRENCVDVHTSGSSTPTAALSPQIVIHSSSSPSSSFPCSQDNCPDVVWDYNSPKLQKGSKSKEIKLTVQEFLENLHQSQVTDPQPGKYIKLVENWLQINNTVVKKEEKCKKQKKKSKQAIEGLKEFLHTWTTAKDCGAGSTSNGSSEPPASKPAESNSKAKPSSICLLEDKDSASGNDSTDEVWGDIDNSFIVKATQELEAIAMRHNDKPKVEEVVSTIPETAPVAVHSNQLNNKQQSLSFEMCNSFLEQLSNIDWGSDDDGDWDNGFIADSNDLPEGILTGSTALSEERTLSYTYTDKSGANGGRNVAKKESASYKNSSSESGSGACVSRQSEPSKDKMSSSELFNSFEDDSFEVASFLCQPEVLSKIDEVESMASQQLRCTPDEIEKKKVEAINRRKKKQSLCK